MANKGWDQTQGGTGWPSNARTTGRTTGVDGAEALVQGSRVAHTGMIDNDPLDKRGDFFGNPGQLEDDGNTGGVPV